MSVLLDIKAEAKADRDKLLHELSSLRDLLGKKEETPAAKVKKEKKEKNAAVTSKPQHPAPQPPAPQPIGEEEFEEAPDSERTPPPPGPRRTPPPLGRQRPLGLSPGRMWVFQETRRLHENRQNRLRLQREKEEWELEQAMLANLNDFAYRYP